MSDWNKNKNQPSGEDDDDDLNLDWLNDEFKKGQPGKPSGGESTGLTGQLPWLQGGGDSDKGLPEDDDDELLNEWQSTKKGIQPTQRGDSTGLTGALDWQKAAPESGKSSGSGESTGITGALPWQDSGTPAASDDDDEQGGDFAPAASSSAGDMPDWLSGADEELADSGEGYGEYDDQGYTDEEFSDAPVETGSLLGRMSNAESSGADVFNTDDFDDFDVGEPVQDEVPDWLQGLDTPGDAQPANDAGYDFVDDAEQPAAEADIPAWLADDFDMSAQDDAAAVEDDDEQPVMDDADWMSGFPDDAPVATSPAAQTEVPAWLADDFDMSAQDDAAVEDEGEQPVMDDADWMSGFPEDTATEQPAAAPGEVPEWLADDFGTFETGAEIPGEVESAYTGDDSYLDNAEYATDDGYVDNAGYATDDGYVDNAEYATDDGYVDNAEYATDAGYEYEQQGDVDNLFGEDDVFGDLPPLQTEVADGENVMPDFDFEDSGTQIEATGDADNLFDDFDFDNTGVELEPAAEEDDLFADMPAAEATGSADNLFDDFDFDSAGEEIQPAADEDDLFADFPAAETEGASDDANFDNLFGDDEPSALPQTTQLEPASDASWLNDAMDSDDFAPAATEAAGDDEFGWLDDMEETPDAEPVAEANDDDWMSDLGAPVEAEEEAVSADDMDFDTLFGDQDDEGDGMPAVDTDYLKSMVGNKADAGDDWFNEDVDAEAAEPDWLSSLEDMPEEALPPPPPVRQQRAAPQPEPEPETDFDLDRLLDDIDPAPARPGMTAELTNPDFDRLFGAEDDEIPAPRPPSRNAMPDFDSILEQAERSGPADPSDMSNDNFDVPDWLREAASSGGVESGTSAAALIRRQKDRPLNDMDERLQALRESGLSLAGEKAAGEDAESSRRLAAVLPGLKEGLSRGDVHPAESASSVISQTLRISPEQEQRAALLLSLAGAGAAGKVLLDQDGRIHEEARPQAQRQVRRSPLALLTNNGGRLLITLILLVAVIIPFYQRLDTGSDLPLAFAAGSSGDQTYQRITALPAGSLVLVAAEYGPAGAAELDDLTRILLTHILQRGARPVIVSTNPVGLLHADNLITDITGGSGRNTAFYTIAYLPGSGVGVRNLAINPASIFATDINGSATGLTITSVQDFAQVVIVTDNVDALRNWMEQVTPLLTIPPIVASGYAAMPLVEPYVQGSAPLLVGFRDAYTYTAMLTGGAITPPPVETLPPTIEPTEAPIVTAEVAPTELVPTEVVTTEAPTVAATEAPTEAPSATLVPTSTKEVPTDTPTIEPTQADTFTPTIQPSATNTLPPTWTFTPSPAPLVEVALVTADSIINARSGAGTSFDIVGQIRPGDRVMVKGYNNSQKQWVNVVLADGTEGWVAGFLVRVSQVSADQAATQVAPRRNRQPPRRNTNNRHINQGGEITPVATSEATSIVLPTTAPTMAVPTLAATLPAEATVEASADVLVQAAAIPNGDARRDAMTLGTLAAVLLIMVGNIYYIVRWTLKRED